MKLLAFLSYIWTVLLTADGQCTGKADIVLAVPGYSAVPDTEFNAFEPGLIQLFDHFQIEPDQINIGLILYGENTINIASPQPFKTRTQVNTRATLLGQREIYWSELGSRGDLVRAIGAVSEMLHSPPDHYSDKILRPGARKIGIIFTYGTTEPSDVQKVIDAAKEAKDSGILMYALNNNSTGKDFEQLGTDHCRLFSTWPFETVLRVAVPYLASAICSELDPDVNIVPNKCFPKRYGTLNKTEVTCSLDNYAHQADPDNCAYFYQCGSPDDVPIHKPCQPNTLYDPSTSACSHLESVACYSNLKCTSAVPNLYPHPLDCSKFINCDSNLVPHVQNCQDGLLFDVEKQACNYPEQVTCKQ